MKKMISLVLTAALLLTMLVAPASAANLKVGSSGTQVRYLELQLTFFGYLDTYDTKFDAVTKAAVMAYQKDRGLKPVDGISGNITNGALKQEVQAIQRMLTALGYNAGTADGIPGTKTVRALTAFQRAYGLDATGTVDEQTAACLQDAYDAYLAALAEAVEDFRETAAETWTLPLKDSFAPVTGSRRFGTSRENGKRSHAGIDFVAEEGTPVYAMTDGKVSSVYGYYRGTDAVQVTNADGSVLLYAEIKPAVKAGTKVSQGDLIGYILATDEKYPTEMLHLELYYGIGSGELTQKSNKIYDFLSGNNLKYGRRSDLLDPTFLLDCAIAE